MQRGARLLAGALGMAFLLSACTSAADQRLDEYGAGDSPNPTATTTPVTGCRARVSLTGPVTESWSGSGSAASTLFAGPPIVYAARHGDTEVRLFAPDSGYAPTVTVVQGTRAWGISPPQQGSIRPDGSGAQVRTRAVRLGIGGLDLSVDAVFRC